MVTIPHKKVQKVKVQEWSRSRSSSNGSKKKRTWQDFKVQESRLRTNASV